MADNKTSYGNIFKTTFLFGFVQLFKAVISIIKNKLVAILIGPEGMGLLGIYNTTIQVIQTGAGLGINQSAVRDIAEANGINNKKKISKIISATNNIVLMTGALGCLVTLLFSKKISEWTLGDSSYKTIYCLLSIVVALNIINEGKQAILKGLRQLRYLAYASLIGTSVSLFSAVTLYYFWGMDGIVPELLIASIMALGVSQFYINKIPVIKQNTSFKEKISISTPMLRMGIALMFVTFLQTIVSLIINAYIRSKGGLHDVGIFSAGNTIVASYFGLITTALMTDYYPRIAAVNKDNDRLQEELNKQSIACLILSCPLIVLFITSMPIFIKILYSGDFLPAVEFLQYSIFWTIITLSSNQVDMILVAKYETKIFIGLSIVIRLLQLSLCLVLYNKFSLQGLGISYGVLGVVHFIVMSFVVNRLYNISFSKEFYKIAFVVVFFSIMADLANIVPNVITVVISIITVFFSCIFSYNVSKNKLGINLFEIIYNKIKK